MTKIDLIFGVSDFVAIFNQTIEHAYPSVIISGELSNFRVAKNKWVYFDLKDEAASIRFFGTVYQLATPLQDGMVLRVKGMPRLHPLYGLSINILSLQPVGEGSIKKATLLLKEKLVREGLFQIERKRVVPYPPRIIGLITSAESAAYHDFMKILSARWGGMEIRFVDVQVQGEPAASQIIDAISRLNQQITSPDVIVITRGGGSLEDLQIFSTEQITRAVAASRIPTIVAIGHEVDVSLAELAADRRASTPSNAAELLVPDRQAILQKMYIHQNSMSRTVQEIIRGSHSHLDRARRQLDSVSSQCLAQIRQSLGLRSQLLHAFNPESAMRRGYALVRKDSRILHSGTSLQVNDELCIELLDAEALATVRSIKMKGIYGAKRN